MIRKYTCFYGEARTEIIEESKKRDSICEHGFYKNGPIKHFIVKFFLFS